ncbi:hypothetical protein OsI_00842 [Oryza sativa Indica Group]|uniref:Uncharacterized protein n=1 Tax=Oryza sativa subsp. indica TaxID=39946 RepID=B8ACQ5_ORYSI|nr:hypothetical protein OsI_00842 [Oryza sativa Indica Group]
MDGERQRWPAMRETAWEKWDPAAAARTRKLRRSASNGREARRGGGGSSGKLGCWMRLPALAKVKVIGKAPELSLDTPRSSCTLDEERNGIILAVRGAGAEEVADTSASFAAKEGVVAAKTDDVAARRPRMVAAAARWW